MNTREIYELLKKRYDGDAHALMFEVANGTGGHARRWADLVVMSLWPSRGLYLHGHEVKVSRTDWVRELKAPEKAEAVCQFCDYWWIVAPKEIVRIEELPDTWGLMIPNGPGLRVARQAVKMDACPIDRLFIAAMLRAAAKPFVRDERLALRAEYERGRDDGLKAGERERAIEAKEADDLRKRIEEFEEAAGLTISGWRDKPKHIGQVVADVLSGKYSRNRSDLDRIREIAQGIIERIDAHPPPAAALATARGER